MKKALTTLLIAIRVITVYLTVVIDRLTMALFIGVDLPPFAKKDIIVDENTTDDQIAESIKDEQQHELMFRNEYLPKARRRAWKAITLSLGLYFFIILSWLKVLIVVSTVVLLVIVHYLTMRIINRKK